MRIYLIENGAQTGPHDRAKLEQMLAKRRINLSTPAWKEGLSDWITLSQLGENFFTPPPLPKKRRNLPGIISCTLVVVVAFLWITIFVLSGIMTDRSDLDMAVTFLFPPIATLNLSAIVCGIAGLKKKGIRTTAIIGTGFSSLQGLAFLSLLCAYFLYCQNLKSQATGPAIQNSGP